ncbi:MAG: fumarylacetoacetase [Devosia nanyangense]|uniref:fumarylacetoacetase n=1 Tax=Devosia nanyangense TaxID=1228055 RepID=A0A933L302_9HYPH|nr:fumarylacetoacetase [Devosia nanyangense]
MSARGLDETHDPAAKSWVASANDPASQFPIQNLPFGSFRPKGETGWRLCVAIGDQVLDLRALAGTGLLDDLSGDLRTTLAADLLNPLLMRPPADWTALRRALFAVLSDPTPDPRAVSALVPQSVIEFRVPMHIGGYTDFFASIHHARRTAKLMRGVDEVATNYRHLPVGYNGRASSVVVSGTPVLRPNGQFVVAGSLLPQFGPSRRLDFELEIAAIVGGSNALGRPVPIACAEDRIFGLCLMNDWSARDIQGFEYQPLGPFLGKSFATTISPWIVTLDALKPFRTPLESHPKGDPVPLPHLREPDGAKSGFALDLTAGIATAVMRVARKPPTVVTRTQARYLYWSFAQMVAHHTSNGCNLLAGDLIGSGTVSGPAETEAASLLELSANGTRGISLGDVESRTYLEDGDEVVLDGLAVAAGRRSIGFGLCTGVIVPAPSA